MKLTSLPRILCLSFLCSIATVHAAPLVLQDNFDSQTATDGTPIDSQPLGNTQTMWEATPNAMLVKGAGIRASDDNPFVCRIALPPDLKEVTVEAELKLNSAGKGWMSVGMGSGAVGNPNFGGLFLLVYPGGTYALMFNPMPDDTRSASVVTLKGGRIQTWNPDGMNTLKLVYNKESDTVSAYANGSDELVKDFSMKDKSLSLKPQFAGVSGIYQTSESRSVGKFTATISK